MGVKFSVLGGDSPPTQFSDNFVRPNSSTLGPDWTRMLANSPTAGGTSASGVDSIAANKMVLSGSGQLNPVVFYEPFWTPVGVFKTLYTKDRTFVQCTVDSIALAGAGTFVVGLGLRFNTDLRSGAGVREYDCYWLTIENSGNGGAVLRLTSVGTTQIIASQGWTVPNTFGMRVSGLGSSVLVETFLNGIAGSSFVDTDNTRILSGSPGILFRTLAGQTNNNILTSSAFSCGVF